MENTPRNAYDASVKLKAMDQANEEGNKDAACKLYLSLYLITVKVKEHNVYAQLDSIVWK